MGMMINYIKPYWKDVIAIVILTMTFVVAQLMVMTETKTILNLGTDTDSIIFSGIKMMIYSLIYGGGALAVSYLGSRLTASLTCDMRRDVFSKIMTFSQSDFNHFGGSSLMTRVTADIARMQIFFINVFRDMMQIPIVIVALTIIAFFLDPVLALVLFSVFIITIVFLFITSSKSIPLFTSVQVKLDNLNRIFGEKLEGVRTIRAFGRQSHETKRFDESNDDLNEESYRAALKVYHLAPIGILIMNLTTVLIYFLGSYELKMGMGNISDLFLFVQYVSYFVSCLAIVPFLVKTIPKTIVSGGRLNEVLTYENVMDTSKSTKTPTNGDVEFRNVSFGYHGEGNVISEISFTAKKGTTTALIGSTGSGKSTIINLINRMHDPTSGQILIGGTDISDVDLEMLRKQISVAPQKTMVMYDTVYANVAMGSSIPKEKAEEACEITMFSEVLGNLPQGIDTVMVQGGMNVSGGQRQRLSLARTVAKDADIYVFDDCFSALDAKTEATVRSNIKKQLQGKTVIMVAQKINTIRDADEIIVLDKGKIVNHGTHDYLMKECELYREFYAVQSYVSKEEE